MLQAQNLKTKVIRGAPGNAKRIWVGLGVPFQHVATLRKLLSCPIQENQTLEYGGQTSRTHATTQGPVGAIVK